MFDCTHWLDIGARGANDLEIFNWTAANDAIVLTRDLDFGEILAATGASKPSTVVLRTREDVPEEIGSTIIGALNETRDVLESGAIVLILPGRTRLRVLPIRERAS